MRLISIKFIDNGFPVECMENFLIIYFVVLFVLQLFLLKNKYVVPQFIDMLPFPGDCMLTKV